jgi:outer membrane biosynthesis protein TonB
MAKPAPKAQDEPGDATEAKPARPRTVKEALARMQNTRLAGEKMKQDGGVARHALEPGFDVAASPFGAYDRALIDAVSSRWYSLLDQNEYIANTQGKVVLQFHLHPDGSITEMNVAENTVGEMLCLLCQRAILDPQPFPVWPADMRRLLGTSRSIQFTFYYN